MKIGDLVDGPGAIAAVEAAHDPESLLDIVDDFVSGHIESGEIGSLGWSSLGAQINGAPSETNHPGIYTVYTLAEANNRNTLFLPDSGIREVLLFPDLWEMTFIVKTEASIADLVLFIGAIDSINAAPGNQDRAGFEFDTSQPDTNWMMCTGDGAASTRTDSGIALAVTTFYKLKIKKLATNYEFYIDGTLKGTLSTNLPNTNFCIGLSVETLAVAAKYLAIDFFRWRQTGITR